MLLTPELSSSAGQLCCADGNTAETSSNRFFFCEAVAEHKAPVISSVRTTEAPEQN